MKKYISSIILGFLILIILGATFWGSGGIILLDYIATNHASISIFQSGWFLIPQIIVSIIGYILGTKLIFILILILAAYLGFLFGRKISEIIAPKYQTILEVFGGVFFLMNPFAYERMMVQPTIYLGIICLGYAIYSLLFITKWKYIYAGIFAGVAFNLFPHASYMIALIFGLYALLFARDKKGLFGLCISAGIVLLLNLNWLLAPLFGVANSAMSISSFGTANLEAFRTEALAPMGVWVTNILLYGFWGEKYSNHYVNVEILSSLWYVAGFLILAIGIYGAYSMGKIKNAKSNFGKGLLLYLGLLAFFSLIFAIGIASPLTAGLTEWMIAHVPLWQGYREPQKWIGLLMIVEGIALITGLAYLLERWGRDIVVKWSIIVATGLLILVWSPGPLLGYHGQLRTTVYPEEFEQLRTDLMQKEQKSPLSGGEGIKGGGRILALPWHSYIGCSWTGRPVISNPIKGLMSPLDVISSDNIEVADTLYTNSTSPESHQIEAFIRDHDFGVLSPYQFTDILLMKQCASSDQYIWLESNTACKKTFSGSVVDLYSCQ